MIRAYIRVSDRSQVEKFGMDAQRETIEQWVNELLPNENLVFYVEEGVSGTIPFDKRPQSSMLLNDLQEGDLVVCAFASRYSRKLWISAKLVDDVQDKGAIICLPELGKITIENRPMFYFRSYEAESERISTLKNTHNGREAKRKAGGYIGGKPQPWQRYDKELKEPVDDPKGLETVLLFAKLYKEGLKQVEIVKLLADNGTPKSKQVISAWSKLLKDETSEMFKKVTGGDDAK